MLAVSNAAWYSLSLKQPSLPWFVREVFRRWFLEVGRGDLMAGALLDFLVSTTLVRSSSRGRSDRLSMALEDEDTRKVPVVPPPRLLSRGVSLMLSWGVPLLLTGLLLKRL